MSATTRATTTRIAFPLLYYYCAAIAIISLNLFQGVAGVHHDTTTLQNISYPLQHETATTTTTLSPSLLQSPTAQEEETFVFPTSWTVLSIFLGTLQAISICCSVAFLFLLFYYRETRKNGFNLYIAFLVLPDLVINGYYFLINCVLPATRNGKSTDTSCKLMLAVVAFYFTANMSLNAILAYEVHNIVQRSYRRMRTGPPSRKRVYLQVLGVYTFAALYSTWLTMDVSWSPYAIAESRMYCQGSFGSNGDDGFFPPWSGYIIIYLVSGLPFAYVAHIGLRIWKEKLLPKSGKTRAIYLYFNRIMIIFFAFYFPLGLLHAVWPSLQQFAHIYWVTWTIYLLTCLQSLLTVRFAMTKDDIWKAFSRSPIISSYSLASRSFRFAGNSTFLSTFFVTTSAQMHAEHGMVFSSSSEEGGGEEETTEAFHQNISNLESNNNNTNDDDDIEEGEIREKPLEKEEARNRISAVFDGAAFEDALKDVSLCSSGPDEEENAVTEDSNKCKEKPSDKENEVDDEEKEKARNRISAVFDGAVFDDVLADLSLRSDDSDKEEN